ncbi:helix-hairpin-helix domain-containing protein [Marivirga sp.]|uniref:helix-hairpin-helix domain-containing protein n=1 Tax=Marivirga sp. TaxID=2018662 RepID=UPI002D80C773|nr:helix-hairpin-helix domain-containing protein [Marivirga sp.]HET8859775.1 helix-hairpin-helix domain-containing protein [Marivirga sp.]
MVLILFAPFINKKILLLQDKKLSSKEDQRKLSLLLEEISSKIEVKTMPSETTSYNIFDLNKDNSKQLASAGIPKYLAERIVKFREKVTPFYSKTDLLKIYGLDSALYQKLEPFIRISKVEKKPLPKTTIKTEKEYSNDYQRSSDDFVEVKKKEKLQPFNINEADSFQLRKIYGIGPAYSSRIIKYREYLGGFYSLQQLEEVYGLKKENIDSLKKYIFLDEKLNVKKLKVNTLKADSLVQHPYISYKEANLIVNYRNQHGSYSSAEELYEIKVLDSNWVKKVTPYLSFD